MLGRNNAMQLRAVICSLRSVGEASRALRTTHDEQAARRELQNSSCMQLHPLDVQYTEECILTSGPD